MDRLIQLGTDIAGLWGTYWKKLSERYQKHSDPGAGSHA